MIQEFLASVIATHKTGSATEHSYRPALQKLFNALDSKVTALNEPKREKVGAPDFSISRGEIVIGHCEAKDLDVDLKKMKDANAAQKARYIGGLSNLLYTNCLEWLWYRDGELVAEVRIADFLMGIQPIPANFASLENLLREFIAQTPQTIKSSRALALRMAGKAALIKDVLANALLQDKDHDTELYGQYETFKDLLIHDISIADFADMYAETIVYGMFAARLNDRTLEDFSRQEALDLLPKSNPFLRNLFSYIAGPTLDERIVWIIDDLAKVFQAADVFALMERYGKTTQRNDPFLHFYEDFLAAYNPKKREVRGVWYTPEPVVDFIVRAVDDILKAEFGIADGLADNRKITIDWETGQTDKRGKAVKTKKEVHKVQILDPAAGTGTFLAQAIKHVAPRIQAAAPGMWASYVEKDLIPRLHGFELLMASYAMCHMKLEMVLREYGYKPTASPPRVSVYLTNSLEEGDAANQTLPFAQWLSNEVKEANTVKRDMPIMCVIGNPPYRGESTNKGDWIMGLMEAYKKEPGGVEKLKERNPKWINDDYVKFIRMSEAMIDRNSEGVLGFITNHGYLDNPTFRGMRWHLLKTFDKIYVLDLHGNAKKREVSPDGSADHNVFDIQQGVAIVVGVKTQATVKGDKRKKGEDIPLAAVFRADLWGDRKSKYRKLWDWDLRSVPWEELELHGPNFPFVVRDWKLAELYESGFSIRDMFLTGTLGFQTHRDSFAIDMSKEELAERLKFFRRSDVTDEEIRQRYGIKDNRDWQLTSARELSRQLDDEAIIKRCAYRPFDARWCILSEVAMDYPRPEFNSHIVDRDNLTLALPRQLAFPGYRHALVTNLAAESCLISTKTKEGNVNFPLYQFEDLDGSCRVNYDPKIYAQLRSAAANKERGTPDEIAVFDYMYGVLYCPAYRDKYAEFLKIDFPRIPLPASPRVFWDVSDKGGELRKLHLMEADTIGKADFAFAGEGDQVVKKPEHRSGKVWINGTQFFDAVPSVSWGFHIGSHQPAQKWLKDRKGRALTFDDVKHYQKILKILAETDRIMRTIDMPL